MFFHAALTVHMLQEVLNVELSRLQQFFQEVKFCRLPLNPALVVQGIEADVSVINCIFNFGFKYKGEKERTPALSRKLLS